MSLRDSQPAVVLLAERFLVRPAVGAPPQFREGAHAALLSALEKIGDEEERIEAGYRLLRWASNLRLSEAAEDVATLILDVVGQSVTPPPERAPAPVTDGHGFVDERRFAAFRAEPPPVSRSVEAMASPVRPWWSAVHNKPSSED